MNNLTAEDAQRLQGATMTDRNSDRIGKVVDVYLDDATEQPEWALVHTGMFGGRATFVPLAESALTKGELQVPYSRAKVKDAPNAEPDGELSQDEEVRLFVHYGLDYSDGSGNSGPTTGNAMTRSEERLNVGVVKRPSQTVRLRNSITRDVDDGTRDGRSS